MANHEPDKEMFDTVKSKIKDLTDALTQWQQRESAIHSLAENRAKSAGTPPEQLDAQVYAHKKMLKKAMADQAKQMEQGQMMESGQMGPMPPMPMGPQPPLTPPM